MVVFITERYVDEFANWLESEKVLRTNLFRKITFWRRIVNLKRKYDFNDKVLDLYFEIPKNVLGLFSENRRYNYGLEILSVEESLESIINLNLTGLLILKDEEKEEDIEIVSDYNRKHFNNNIYWNRSSISLYIVDKNRLYVPYVLRQTLFEKFMEKYSDDFLDIRRKPY